MLSCCLGLADTALRPNRTPLHRGSLAYDREVLASVGGGKALSEEVMLIPSRLQAKCTEKGGERAGEKQNCCPHKDMRRNVSRESNTMTRKLQPR